jgi:hypothetical protein
MTAEEFQKKTQKANFSPISDLSCSDNVDMQDCPNRAPAPVKTGSVTVSGCNPGQLAA